MVCASVRENNPQALAKARGLLFIQALNIQYLANDTSMHLRFVNCEIFDDTH